MRALALACISLLVLALFGACGGGGGGSSGGEGGGPVTIDFWHSESAANLDTLERMTDRFNSSQDEVRVRLVFQGNDEEAMAKLMVSLRADEVPAIAYLAEVDTQKMIDSGAVAPIQDFVDRDAYDLSDLDEKAIGYYRADGRLWAMPMSMAVPLLYYNKTAFRDAGLEPEQPPSDLEELRTFSQTIYDTSDGDRAGIALDITGWYMDLTIAEHGDLFADQDNGREGRATEVLFDNDTGQWFFQWWHDMVEQGLAMNVGRNPTGAEALLAIGAGHAASAFGSSAALRSVFDVLEEGIEGVELGVAAQPGVPGGTGLPGIYSRSLWVLNRRPEREQEAAWTFIQWLMEPEQQAEWFAGSGYLPVTRSSLDLPAAQDVVNEYPAFAVPLDLYLRAEATPASLGALLGPFREVREAIAEGVEQMLLSSKDPLQALRDAAAKSDQALADYNERIGE